MGKTIPTSDADFNVRQQVISTTVEANLMPWLIDAEWMNTEFTPEKLVWEKAWELYLNPETRTPVIIFVKSEAKKGHEPPLRQLNRYMIS